MKYVAVIVLLVSMLGCRLFKPGPTPDPTPEPFNGIEGVIEITNLKRNQVICADGQVTIEGRARGWWYFEATFPVDILDTHGQPIGQHYAEAQGEWMTNDFVPFKAVVKFREPQGLNGSIVFHRSDPSGGFEGNGRPRKYVMPVRFQHQPAC